MTTAQILATGPEFIGKGVRGIEPVIEDMITQAEKELQLVAYVFTPSARGIFLLLNRAAERGVRVTVVVNCKDSQHPEVRAWLDSVSSQFPSVRVVDFCEPGGRQLHAKLIISDRRRAVIGSANFSWGGMVGNYEFGVLLEGEPAWKLAELVDSFVSAISNPRKMTRGQGQRYRKQRRAH